MMLKSLSIKSLATLIFVVTALLSVAEISLPYWTHSTETVTVTGTVVKQYGSEGQSKYLVFTNSGVFENTDTFAYLKFNSSDIQGQLMQGGTFDISYYGFRIPFLSHYPNITSAMRVK